MNKETSETFKNEIIYDDHERIMNNEYYDKKCDLNKNIEKNNTTNEINKYCDINTIKDYNYSKNVKDQVTSYFRACKQGNKKNNTLHLLDMHKNRKNMVYNGFLNKYHLHKKINIKSKNIKKKKKKFLKKYAIDNSIKDNNNYGNIKDNLIKGKNDSENFTENTNFDFHCNEIENNKLLDNNYLKNIERKKNINLKIKKNNNFNYLKIENNKKVKKENLTIDDTNNLFKLSASKCINWEKKNNNLNLSFHKNDYASENFPLHLKKEQIYVELFNKKKVKKKKNKIKKRNNKKKSSTMIISNNKERENINIFNLLNENKNIIGYIDVNENQYEHAKKKNNKEKTNLDQKNLPNENINEIVNNRENHLENFKKNSKNGKLEINFFSEEKKKKKFNSQVDLMYNVNNYLNSLKTDLNKKKKEEISWNEDNNKNSNYLDKNKHDLLDKRKNNEQDKLHSDINQSKLKNKINYSTSIIDKRSKKKEMNCMSLCESNYFKKKYVLNNIHDLHKCMKEEKKEEKEENDNENGKENKNEMENCYKKKKKSFTECNRQFFESFRDKTNEISKINEEKEGIYCNKKEKQINAYNNKIIKEKEEKENKEKNSKVYFKINELHKEEIEMRYTKENNIKCIEQRVDNSENIEKNNDKENKKNKMNIIKKEIINYDKMEEHDDKNKNEKSSENDEIYMIKQEKNRFKNNISPEIEIIENLEEIKLNENFNEQNINNCHIEKIELKKRYENTLDEKNNLKDTDKIDNQNLDKKEIFCNNDENNSMNEDEIINEEIQKHISYIMENDDIDISKINIKTKKNYIKIIFFLNQYILKYEEFQNSELLFCFGESSEEEIISEKNAKKEKEFELKKNSSLTINKKKNRQQKNRKINYDAVDTMWQPHFHPHNQEFRVRYRYKGSMRLKTISCKCFGYLTSKKISVLFLFRWILCGKYIAEKTKRSRLSISDINESKLQELLTKKKKKKMWHDDEESKQESKEKKKEFYTDINKINNFFLNNYKDENFLNKIKNIIKNYDSKQNKEDVLNKLNKCFLDKLFADKEETYLKYFKNGKKIEEHPINSDDNIHDHFCNNNNNDNNDYDVDSNNNNKCNNNDNNNNDRSNNNVSNNNINTNINNKTNISSNSNTNIKTDTNTNNKNNINNNNKTNSSTNINTNINTNTDINTYINNNSTFTITNNNSNNNNKNIINNINHKSNNDNNDISNIAIYNKVNDNNNDVIYNNNNIDNNNENNEKEHFLKSINKNIIKENINATKKTCSKQKLKDDIKIKGDKLYNIGTSNNNHIYDFDNKELNNERNKNYINNINLKTDKNSMNTVYNFQSNSSYNSNKYNGNNNNKIFINENKNIIDNSNIFKNTSHNNLNYPSLILEKLSNKNEINEYNNSLIELKKSIYIKNKNDNLDKIKYSSINDKFMELLNKESVLNSLKLNNNSCNKNSKEDNSYLYAIYYANKCKINKNTSFNIRNNSDILTYDSYSHTNNQRNLIFNRNNSNSTKRLSNVSTCPSLCKNTSSLCSILQDENYCLCCSLSNKKNEYNKDVVNDENHLKDQLKKKQLNLMETCEILHSFSEKSPKLNSTEKKIFYKEKNNITCNENNNYDDNFCLDNLSYDCMNKILFKNNNKVNNNSECDYKNCNNKLFSSNDSFTLNNNIKNVKTNSNNKKENRDSVFSKKNKTSSNEKINNINEVFQKNNKLSHINPYSFNDSMKVVTPERKDDSNCFYCPYIDNVNDEFKIHNKNLCTINKCTEDDNIKLYQNNNKVNIIEENKNNTCCEYCNFYNKIFILDEDKRLNERNYENLMNNKINNYKINSSEDTLKYNKKDITENKEKINIYINEENNYNDNEEINDNDENININGNKSNKVYDDNKMKIKEIHNFDRKNCKIDKDEVEEIKYSKNRDIENNINKFIKNHINNKKGGIMNIFFNELFNSTKNISTNKENNSVISGNENEKKQENNIIGNCLFKKNNLNKEYQNLYYNNTSNNFLRSEIKGIENSHQNKLEANNKSNLIINEKSFELIKNFIKEVKGKKYNNNRDNNNDDNENNDRNNNNTSNIICYHESLKQNFNKSRNRNNFNNLPLDNSINNISDNIEDCIKNKLSIPINKKMKCKENKFLNCHNNINEEKDIYKNKNPLNTEDYSYVIDNLNFLKESNINDYFKSFYQFKNNKNFNSCNKKDIYFE
ncbi:transcription factor with AP2 domain(s), putative [Plasmodium gallinaceum]|uniref:Transcription factor with AP2 domain(S), putative n=1 Tax=Plasmodium gallinaceum TaxID=5849 RepID=A0A1J1GNF2_PLAGA|nr:transcription factor with AP2 domain(s), putative [Plasmodium gallinaceum]CRG93805.1 transcription factor with AP2 domain(s), putative [Plasmodium gallinaceum]